MKKKDKTRVSWLKRLFRKIDILDTRLDYKLYPAIIVVCCFVLLILLALICMFLYG